MRGHDLRDFMLLAFGGAGPVHAGRIARDLGMAGVIVPLYPGVYSAIGLLMSDVKHDYIQSRMTPIARARDRRRRTRCSRGSQTQAAQRSARGRLRRPTDRHRARARHALRRPGLRDHDAVRRRAGRRRARGAAPQLRRAAPAACSATWRRRSRSRSCPIACAASAGCRRSRCRNSSRTGATLADALRETRQVRFDGDDGRLPGLSAREARCRPDVAGPAILDQFDCTTVICPGRPRGSTNGRI